MKSSKAGIALTVALVLTLPALAQNSVPMLVNYGGVLRDTNSQPLTGTAGVTFLLYKEREGGAPLWMETQNVMPDPRGRYTVTLGATSSEGLPAFLFASAEARWLAVQVAAQPELERVLLVSAPYALKAKDAETIGGLPPSAFVLAPAAPATAAQPQDTRDIVPDTACTAITSDGTATPNKVAKFTAPCAMEPSAILESGGKVGIGTTTPAATLDVKGTATFRGALTMNAKTAATASAGSLSNPLDLLAATFDGSTDTSISQHFRWQAEAAGNDTASPSGTLNLLYAPGNGTPAEIGLAVNSKGLMTFAPNQTFPGAGTITGVTVGAGLTGGGTAGAVNVGLTAACANGQVLQWNGGNWTCAAVNSGTITGLTAGAGLSGGATSGNITLANTGVLSLIAGTGITSSGGNAPTISLNTAFTDGRYLQLSGGMLSGPLNLPANGLTEAGNQLVLAGGNLGIGTVTPGAPLEVAGNMKISGAASTLTFPDGTTQATAGTPASVVAGVNPLRLALLKWFPAYQSSATFGVGGFPQGVAFDGTNIWVANYHDSTVTKLLAATGRVVGTYAAGSGPLGIAFDGANIWVASYLDGGVTKLLASTGALVGSYTGGGWSTELAFDGLNIWVTNYADRTVTKVLASNGVIVGSYPVGSDPIGVAFDGVNIWVANQGGNSVTKLLASTGAILGTFSVGSGPAAVAFDGANIWVANQTGNSVTKLLASTGQLVSTYTVGSGPAGIALDGTDIWVVNATSNNVTKLLAATGAVLGTYAVGNNPFGVAFDGANIWVTNSNDNTVGKL